ncbi:hypothetical protein DFH09DRAFT_1153305 [Mycena vulgaris]|nr:hypothetical protein DFH09DRAFT_1153305 [Mycena vulgaris]
MKLALASFLVVLTELSVAQAFFWRLYNNGACNHNSTAAQTFPPNPAAARSTPFDQCITTPQGIQWNAIEVDTSQDLVDLFLFCGPGCTGQTQETISSVCNSPPTGCAISSLLGFPVS